MDWNPDYPDDPQFWPGGVERRGPRWVPIMVALGVVIVVLALLIWWFGRDNDDDVTATDDDTEQVAADTVDDSVPDSTDQDPDGTTESAPQTTSTTTTTTVGPTTTTIPEILELPEGTEDLGPPTLSTNSTVSTVGLDSVHFGMTIAEAQEAAGTALVPVGTIGVCYHVVPAEAPDGVVFLVYSGTIERVDINSGPITTRSGVGVGSPESMVTDLFSANIERQVRADGTVDLVFVPTDPGDRDYRVVFNVTDGKVRALKSGRLPQILLDTGCEES